MSGALDLGQLGPRAPLCVCLCVCVCVSGPVAQPWSHSAPTGMWLLSAPRAAPAPHGSGRQEKRREGKGGGWGEMSPASNPPSPNPAADKGQFMPSLSRGGKGGGPNKPSSSGRRQSPGGVPDRREAPGCACLCVRGQRGQEHPPWALTKGRAAVGPACAFGPVPR